MYELAFFFFCCIPAMIKVILLMYSEFPCLLSVRLYTAFNAALQLAWPPLMHFISWTPCGEKPVCQNTLCHCKLNEVWFLILSLPHVLQVSGINAPVRRKREQRVLFMVVVMVVCYLLCWLPYGIMALLATFGSPGMVTPVASIIPSILAKTSTVINPVIYVFMNKQVRGWGGGGLMSVLFIFHCHAAAGGGHPTYRPDILFSRWFDKTVMSHCFIFQSVMPVPLFLLNNLNAEPVFMNEE